MRKRTLVAIASLVLFAVLFALSPASAEISKDANKPLHVAHDSSLDFALAGNHAGSFGYIGIDYPGGGAVVTIQADMAPGDPGAMSGTGFNVYGFNGYLIGSGVPADGTPGRKALRWADTNAQPWLIQVYNYLDNVTVRFHVEITGLPGPTPVPPPPARPDEAAPLAIAASSLVGDHSGRFHYYKIDSTGNRSEVTLRLSYAPDDEWISNGFGMNVYAPSGGMLVAKGGHEAKFKLEMPGTYLIQVYNYLPSRNVTYLLTR